MMRQMFVALAILASSTALWGQPAATRFDAESGTPAIDDKTQTEDVQFKNERDDRMTVPVHVSGQGPFRFLVDTGADHTAISREIAGRLGLARNERRRCIRSPACRWCRRPMFPSSSSRKRRRMFAARRCSTARTWARTGSSGPTRCARNASSSTSGRRPSRSSPRQPAISATSPGTIVVQAQRRKGRLVVTDATANGQAADGRHRYRRPGQHRQRGACGSSLQGRGLLGTSRKGRRCRRSPAQTIIGDYMFVRDLEIGGVTLHNLAIVFTDAHTFHALNLDAARRCCSA